MSEKDEIARLRSVMAAAADEIEQHWDAHCDAEGFGPVNLVRRLRTGKGDYRAGGAALDAALSRRSMTDDLARRAVACRHWRWLPGMRAERWTGPCYGTYRYSDHDVRAHRWWPGGLPVLNDPATLGCLLALVRAAYDDELAHVRPCAGGWDFYTLDPMAPRVTAPSEAQCLVAALEAAP